MMNFTADKNTKIKKTFPRLSLAVLAFITGALAGFFLSIRFHGFWQLSRFNRLVILFFSVAAASALFYLFYYLFLQFSKRSNHKINLILYVLLTVVFCALWLLKIQNEYKSRVPAAWLAGIGHAIEKPITSVLYIFIIPLLIVIIISVIAKTLELSAKKIKWKTERDFYHVIFCATFLILCVLPVVKNRNLTTIEANFLGRSELLGLYNNTRYKLGDRVIGQTIIDENWVILASADSIKDYQNTEPFSGEELKEINRKLVGVKEYLDERGIAFLVISPPNKNTIYPEYLPEVIPVLGDQSRLDQLIEYIEKHSDVQIADMRDAMMEYREEHQLYYASDTHWNPYGAWVGYRVVLDALKQDFPNLEPHDLDDYMIVKKELINGDTAMRLANVNVPEEFFYVALAEGGNSIERIFQKEDSFRRYLTVDVNSDGALPRLLMYHDSFTLGLMPFLSDHFSESAYLLINITGKDLGFDLQFADIAKPDVVIIELTERFIERLSLLPDA